MGGGGGVRRPVASVTTAMHAALRAERSRERRGREPAAQPFAAPRPPRAQAAWVVGHTSRRSDANDARPAVVHHVTEDAGWSMRLWAVVSSGPSRNVRHVLCRARFSGRFNWKARRCIGDGSA